MTADAANDRLLSPTAASPRRPPATLRHGRVLGGARVEQIVATQVAVALPLVAVGRGAPYTIAFAGLAVVLLIGTWLRPRGRWAFQWLATVLRFLARRRAAAMEPTGTALLTFVASEARLAHGDLAGDTATVIADATGLTAVLEVGDPAAVLVEALPDLPFPAALLPPQTPDAPPCRVQVLLLATPAPAVRNGSGTAANSYRQLTEGPLLGQVRVLLAVRVLRAEGWSADDLHRALGSVVRKLRRRLSRTPVRPLGEAALLRLLAEAGHLDGAMTAHENWTGLRLGGLSQATFRLRRWPDLPVETFRRLVTRVLAVPAAATSVALAAGPQALIGDEVATDVTVRLAAATETALVGAVADLRALLAAERVEVRRLDGEHVAGLAATLPLGVGTRTQVPGLPACGVMPTGTLAAMTVPLPDAGLMMGRNRHGSPVIVRLFRPEHTRMLLIGGVRCAQLVALRAMALGARVVVQTARPQAWDPFVRGSAVPGESIAVVPPGPMPKIPPSAPLDPHLTVVDVGALDAAPPPGHGWQATLVVRDEFTPQDIEVASRVDLLIVQPLRADEARLASAALGLGDAADWLTRIRQDMVGVVNRRAVRWATLCTTAIEAQLIGPPTRG